MSISQALLAEVEHEMTGLRTTLERIPSEHLDWSPHEKSMTMRGLATHLINMPRWGQVTVTEAEFDFAPDGTPLVEEPVASVAAGLEKFDALLAGFKTALAGASDEELMAPWALKNNGQVVFALPRVAVLRGFIMNHMIHHRAQLGVYLRLRDVPVPSLYGPSADEAPK